MNTTNERNTYRAILRRVAGILAFVFAFIAATTATHYHTDASPSAQSATFVCLLASPDTATSDDAGSECAPANPAIPSLGVAGCVLCDWISTPLDSLPSISAALIVVLSAISTLILAVRIAALCDAPAPRRGLRAPPALLLA